MKTSNPLTDKAKIVEALKAFDSSSLVSNAIHLFDTLGYRSSKTLQLEPNTTAGLLELANRKDFLNPAKAHADEWQSADFLFQLTDEEIRNLAQGGLDFDSKADVQSNKLIESYIFFAVELRSVSYPRTVLADITREINRLFPMPALVLFKHGKALTLSIINRRIHKRDAARDVLEKVTLIKDIRIEDPHRGQVEILFDLGFPQLIGKHEITDFIQLDEAWRKTLDTSELNKRFYQDLANWYFWALQQVEFPKQQGVTDDVNRATNVIRLITRLIFVWFLKERQLVPDPLFDLTSLGEVLQDLSPDKSTFYKAILQNLFFATLNTPMADKKAPRVFRKETSNGKRFNDQYMVHNQYRHEKLFKNPDQALEMFADIPFLNGGLFECLDKREEINGKLVETRIDGFSDMPKKQPTVPNRLFFGSEEQIDLNETYGTENKRYTVRGLIDTLGRYKFTIAENTPIEEEVALDPELLGKVFENLLASYNPETGATARKQTGSYYTPREIVNYMVDESLIAYLETQLSSKRISKSNANVTARLRQLFVYTDVSHGFSEVEVEQLIASIDALRIFDPACGSGAFPMGILQKLVFILSKLDPNNAKWEQRQISRVREAISSAEKIEDHKFREDTVRDLEAQIVSIEEAFRRNELDYGRKLFLIENCIFGSDIQPIAMQIAKLRFFISLIIDQRIRPEAINLGIIPLPNLETKFVAANVLIGIEKPVQGMLQNEELRLAIQEKERELESVRERHFTARTTQTKEKYRKEDERIRKEIGKLLNRDNWPPETTAKLIRWNPYNQNTSAEFFDPEWMFGLAEGFNVVLGNPPYIDSEMMTRLQPKARETYAQNFDSATGNWDMFVIFIERGLSLLTANGVISYIVPNKLIGATYTTSLREILLSYNIRELRDYSEVNVFKDSAVYPIVFLIERTNRKQRVTMTVMGELEEIRGSNAIDPELFYSDILWDRYFVEADSLAVVVKCSQHKRLDSHFRNVLGAATVGEAYKIKDYLREQTGRESKPFKKFINTGTIDPFASLWSVYRTRYLGHSYKAPIVYEDDLNAMSKRRYDQSAQDKLIIGGMNNALECFYDEGEYLAGKSTTIITDASKDNLKFLCAMLNSRLISFWYRIYYKSLTLAGGYLRIGNNEIKTIPIPEVDQRRQGVIIKLVDQILAVKRNDPSADTGKLEGDIDRLVYDLYELTPEERAIVEASAQR